MKFIFIISFIFLVDIYYYLGVSSVFSSSSSHSFFKFFYWIFSLFIYFSVIYVILNYDKLTPTVNNNSRIILTSIIFISFISKFIGLFPLILDDLLRFFRLVFNLFNNSGDKHSVGRLEFLKKSSLIVSSIIFSTFLLGMKFGRFNFKKNFQNIYINKWPIQLSGYKIIHISDLHLGSFNVEKLEVVVKMINEENPDLVVFTGDLINNYYFEALPFIDTLKKIKAKDGKFSILGNHDYGDYTGLKRSSQEWKDNFSKLVKIHQDSGFELLLNESKVIKKNHNKFNIIGVENWGAGNFNKDGDLNVSMEGVDDSLPSILLSHDPSHWSEQVLKSKYNIDLQLSGHTHGMQFGIELPNFKWSPVKYRYKQWAGLYSINDKQIYVNRGIGHLGYAGRVGIMPDISILNISPNA